MLALLILLAWNTILFYSPWIRWYWYSKFRTEFRLSKYHPMWSSFGMLYIISSNPSKTKILWIYDVSQRDDAIGGGGEFYHYFHQKRILCQITYHSRLRSLWLLALSSNPMHPPRMKTHHWWYAKECDKSPKTVSKDKSQPKAWSGLRSRWRQWAAGLSELSTLKSAVFI